MLCKIQYKNLAKAIWFWRNQVFCLINKFSMPAKRCSRFFSFFKNLELILKKLKKTCSRNSKKPGFLHFY